MNWLVSTLICALLLMPARQQAGEWVKEVALTYEFGSTLEISAVVQAPQAKFFTLYLQPEGQSSRQIEFIPNSEGKVDISFDLNVDPLKPFARVYYWFELENPDGTQIQSPSYWFDYLDNRYTWKTNATDLFDIAWVQGDAAFGQQLQEIAQAGLKKSTQVLPTAPSLPVRIFVYPDNTALEEAMNLANQDWAAGHTAPDIGVIVVSNGSPSSDLVEMERQVPHELMHLLIYQTTGGNPGFVPVWLSEGLATHAELYPDPDLQRVLIEIQSRGKLLPMESLCLGFSSDANLAQLGYAQSASFTQYLLSRFGSEIFPTLLQASTSGQSCSNLVQTTTGVSLTQLENDWLQDSFEVNSNGAALSPLWLAAIGAGGLSFVVLLILLRRRHTKHPHEPILP